MKIKIDKKALKGKTMEQHFFHLINTGGIKINGNDYKVSFNVKENYFEIINFDSISVSTQDICYGFQ